MNKPQIEFIWDKTSQAQYLCFVAKDIVNGCYQRAGFQILPYPVKNLRKSVYFPDLNLSSIFWKYLNSCPHRDLGNQFPTFCVTEIKDRIKNYEFSTRPIDTQYLNHFIADCTKFLNLDMNFKITILITPFGTIGSFRPWQEKGKWHLMATWRTDLPIEYLFNTLLLGMYRIQVRLEGEVDEEVGRQRMVVVDYLTKHTILSKYRPSYLRTHPSTKNIIDSKTYLNKLGFFELVPQPLEAISSQLSSQEKLLFNYLKDNSGNLVEFDKAADIVWGEAVDEKYSLYSLSKIIENIRKKIRSQGINREIIFTSRKRGYIFNV